MKVSKNKIQNKRGKSGENLIATEGSDFSRQAIEKACEMLTGGEAIHIKIISVSEEVANIGTEPFGVSSEYIHEMEDIAFEQATKFAYEAEKLVRGRFADSPAQISTKIIKGSAVRAIVAEAIGVGRGFNRRRLARLRILGTRFSRLDFRQNYSSRAMTGINCARKK